MDPFLQFRLWIREATSVERRAAAVTCLLFVGLVGWALTPISGADGNGAPLQVTDSSGNVVTDPDAERSAAAPRVQAPTDLNDTSGVNPSNGNAPKRGQGGDTVTDGGAAPNSEPEARVASDRGISPDSMKVGFVVANLAGLENSGFALGLRTDIPRVVEALVDAVNDRGGIGGRRVLPVIARVDPLSANDQRAKCLHLTETEKVFAVIDVLGNLITASKQCYTVEHKTPLVSTTTLSAASMAAGFPYDVSPRKDFNRIFKDWAYAARDAGLFDPASGFKKLGLLSEDCEPAIFDDRQSGLKAFLRRVGITEVSEFRVSCDTATAQRQVSQAVLKHKGDGVTHVLPGALFPVIQSYLQQAEAQLYRPEYFVSDFRGLTADVSAANFNPEQWDRVRGITPSRYGEIMAGKPLSELAQKCSKDLTDRGLPAAKDYNADAEALGHCENFTLFKLVTELAGVNPTRQSWGAAVPRVGRFEPATVHLSVFDRPGKVSGGDTIATIEWRRECRCYFQVSGHRPAYA